MQRTGTITGAPTATGNFPFTVRVADTFGQDDTQALSILVSTYNPPQIVPASLPGGTVGVPYGPTTLQATGGIGTLTWNISVGSLPPGLGSVPPSTGSSVTISGTPASQGTFNFTVRVTDSLGQFDTQALSITINLPHPASDITTTSLPVEASASRITSLWRRRKGRDRGPGASPQGHLPLGLNLNQTTGVISGTPHRAGGHIDVYRPSGGRRRTSRHASSVDRQINLGNPPAITTTTLPGGTVGQAYNQTLQATGGIGLLTWTLSGGSLPAMLSLSPAGVISGTPTTTGTANFTVRVTDTLNQSETQALSIAVSTALMITTQFVTGCRRSVTLTIKR